MDIKRLHQFGTLQSYQRGHILFKMGDLDTNMYVILKGLVSLRSKIGDNFKSEILGGGKFFGEIPVILNIPQMHICVIEEDDTTLMAIPRTRFEHFISGDQDFAMRIMRLLSEELLEARGERENIAHRMRKYEAVDATERAEDLYKPLTPEKKQDQNSEGSQEKERLNGQERQETEGQEPEEKEEEMVCEKILQEELPEMPHAMRMLKRVGVVLPNHGVYASKLWLQAAEVLTPKVIACPVCGETFTATYLSRSRLGIAKTSPDMRKQYKNIEPIYFDVYACPCCGYANFPGDFSKLQKQEAEIVLADLLIVKNLLPYDLCENIFEVNYVFLKLYLTLFCNTISKDNVLTAPKIWLRLSWLYEDVGETELAKIATEHAYQTYKDVFYNTKTFSGEAEREVLLLMGELALKLGMEKEATAHFLAVLQSGTTNQVHRRKAEDRVYDLRQKAKQEAAKEAAANEKQVDG